MEHPFEYKHLNRVARAAIRRDRARTSGGVYARRGAARCGG